MLAGTRNKIVLLIVLCAAGVFIDTLLHSAVFVTGDETDQASPAGSIATSSVLSDTAEVPARILIPKIGIDASVQHVGLGKTGNMAVPLSYGDTGWYRYGAVPGDFGSAVIDGHVDNGLGLPGVFSRISELVPGDSISVLGEDGRELRFVVESTSSYPVADVPRQMLFNRKDRARLNLITCEGSWIQDEKMYDRRLVVYAVLAG